MTKQSNSLNDDNIKIEVLRHLDEGLSVRQISRILNVPRSTLGDFIRGESHKDWWEKTNNKPLAAGQISDHYENIQQLSGNRFILTSAQNNTYVHGKFLQSLENMANHVGARIIVGTFTYNKFAFSNLEHDEWYDPKIVPYILNEPAILTDGLLWCGELNINPTAVNPLSGLQSYAKGDSAIVPHVKVQLESLPTHKTLPVRFMYTTGTVTKRNYIQKKSGQKASFHHIFGALIVEVDDDGDWFVRQLIADSETGSFQDLDVLYTPDGVFENQRVEAINWGDVHVEKIDEEAANASFGNDGKSMLDVLKPKYQFFHDVYDHMSRNHHSINDPYFRFQMHVGGTESVEDGVRKVRDLLVETKRDYCKSVVVESNHDLALKRWLKESDYKNDPVNAIFFLECQLEIYKSIRDGIQGFSILENRVKANSPELDDVKFLKTDESFRICRHVDGGIECGQHGHLGANGSRGSVGVYQKLEAKYNIGHTHQANIKDGVYSAGVLGKLDMGYNIGASSWSASNIVTFPNGKRAIVTIKNGKWRVPLNKKDGESDADSADSADNTGSTDNTDNVE